MSSSSIKKRKSILVRILLVFLCLSCLLVLVAGVVLKNGFHLGHFSIGGIGVIDCHIIWRDKLEVQIDTITITKGSKKEKKSGGAVSLQKTVGTVHRYINLFSKLSIDKLVIGEHSIAIQLFQGDGHSYELDLVSPDFRLQSRLKFETGDLVVDIVEAASSQYNSRATGQMRLEAGNDRMSGALSVMINGSFPVSLDFVADSEQISFEGREAGEITDIKPLVDLFGLKPNIQRWITDYLSGSRYHLKSFKGVVPWNNPKVILDTLEAEVRVDDTEYVFAPGLGEPVKGSYTDVYFKKGVLDIKPHDPTFYGQDVGEDSWVDINFNDLKNILLTVNIKTRAVANDDILALLEYYKISLPFKQVEGKTTTDLRLAIILNKKKLSAEAVFEIDESTIEYGGKNHKARDALIKLVNTDFTIERLGIGYENIFMANVQGAINAKTKTGDLDITVQQLSLKLKNSLLNLDESAPAPRIHYSFGPKEHILDVQASSWTLDSLKMNLGAFRAPFFISDLAVELPLVQLGAPPGISTEISGYVSIKKKEARLTCNLLKYHIKDLELISPHIEIDIEYNRGLGIRTTKTALWRLSKIPVTLYPSELTFGDNVLTVVKSGVSYGTFFNSLLAGHYNLEEKKGKFTLEKIDVTHENIKEKYGVGSETKLEISDAEGKFVAYLPEYELTISSNEENKWSATFGDLSVMYDRSKLLQKFKIQEGSVVVSSVNGKRPYDFSADIKIPYPLLVEDGDPVDQVQVSGQLTDAGILATVNKNLHIEYFEKNLKIGSSKLGYNITAIIKLLRELSPSASSIDKEPSDGNPLSLSFKAENSHFYFGPQSRIIADTINLEFVDGKLDMSLIHGPGQIKLQLEEGTFSLDGSDLNDEFMGALIQNSNFRGGGMSIASSGAFDNFSVIFEIKDTTLSNLAALNNIMALLNTVPALITFSLPAYNNEGLPVQSATVGMKYKDKIATFESMEVKSSVFNGVGNGWIDFAKNQIDMDIHLKTQAGSNMGKVPLVGYALAGDDTDNSLSLKIKGEVSDPKVSNSMVKDIVTYPLDVLFRVLALPFRNMVKKQNQPEEKNAASGTVQDEVQTEGNVRQE